MSNLVTKFALNKGQLAFMQSKKRETAIFRSQETADMMRRRVRAYE